MARKYYINNKTRHICFKKRYRFLIGVEQITYALACHVSTFGELKEKENTKDGIIRIIKQFIANNGYVNLDIIDTGKISYDTKEVDIYWERAKDLATEVFTEQECQGFNIIDTYNIYAEQLEKVVAMELAFTPTDRMSQKKIDDLLFSRINNLGYSSYRAFDDSENHFDNFEQEIELTEKARGIVRRVYPRLYSEISN